MRDNRTDHGDEKEIGLAAELWQFAAVLGVFLVAALLWLCIIYLPARTMEHSESRRAAERGRDVSDRAG